MLQKVPKVAVLRAICSHLGMHSGIESLDFLWTYHTLMSLINAQSLITVKGDSLSKIPKKISVCVGKKLNKCTLYVY